MIIVEVTSFQFQALGQEGMKLQLAGAAVLVFQSCSRIDEAVYPA